MQVPITNAIAVAVAPVVIMLVYLLRQSINIDDKHAPLLSLAVSAVIVIGYALSTTGLLLTELFNYIVATVAVGGIASGIYSWTNTVGNTPSKSANRVVDKPTPPSTITIAQ